MAGAWAWRRPWVSAWLIDAARRRPHIDRCGIHALLGTFGDAADGAGRAPGADVSPELTGEREVA
ncbi:hypothetical protein, partial [Pseudomonas sp.]|uniref:hypothetical protein n=1 Tax=Pseudomonas sp. TaxID=306 RepID=UPI003C71DDEE